MSSAPPRSEHGPSAAVLLDLGFMELEAARVLMATMPRGERPACVHVLRAADAFNELQGRHDDFIPEESRMDLQHCLSLVAAMVEPRSKTAEPPQQQLDRAVRDACNILELALLSASNRLDSVGRKPARYARTIPSIIAVVIAIAAVMAFLFRARPPETLSSDVRLRGVTSDSLQLSEGDLFRFQFGDVLVDRGWTRVELKPDIGFQDAVVVAKPASHNDAEPGVVRVRHVDSSGFEIRFQEWDYLDGAHLQEAVSYLVLERGSYTLPGGTRIEAGRFETNRTVTPQVIAFAQTFDTVPIVLASVATYHGENAVTTRLSQVSDDDFECLLQEQQKNLAGHPEESISYVAWEPGLGSFRGMRFAVGRTEEDIRSNFRRIAFPRFISEIPTFLADLQTSTSADPANLRWRDMDSVGVELRIDEERSSDLETGHRIEIVGYVLLAHSETDADATR